LLEIERARLEWVPDVPTVTGKTAHEQNGDETMSPPGEECFLAGCGVSCLVMPALRRLRQEDQEFEASLGCLSQKIKKKKRESFLKNV
jgi:hypothetical protein